MSQFRMPLRIVLYQENGDWIAHCLELDLVGDGSTREKACASLSASINAQLDFYIRHRESAQLFRPAPAEFFKMFAAGKDIAIAELKLATIRDVVVESITSRERSESGETLAVDLASA
ncbi:MAG TPA: hypothetical protein VGX78_17570 [Pirellulales bacterium]|nr:hypothetical protein [Pirellulales bacterium]